MAGNARARTLRGVDRYLVDGMNVIGSRPDGWWRDLDAAVVRLALALAAWQADAGGDVTVVFDGRPPAAMAAVDLGGVEAAFAGPGRAADDEIVRRVGIDPDAGSVRVVTSDRPLAERVRAAGAGEVVGAGGFRRVLDDYG
jgi:predicted RNA-binding protein with PIN domain